MGLSKASVITLHLVKAGMDPVKAAHKANSLARENNAKDIQKSQNKQNQKP